MAQPHIVVVGSANIDLTTLTDAFPRPGETIFGSGFHLGFGGEGANQAVGGGLCGGGGEGSGGGGGGVGGGWVGVCGVGGGVGDALFGPATVDNFRRRAIDTSH